MPLDKNKYQKMLDPSKYRSMTSDKPASKDKEGFLDRHPFIRKVIFGVESDPEYQAEMKKRGITAVNTGQTEPLLPRIKDFDNSTWAGWTGNVAQDIIREAISTPQGIIGGAGIMRRVPTRPVVEVTGKSKPVAVEINKAKRPLEKMVEDIQTKPVGPKPIIEEPKPLLDIKEVPANPVAQTLEKERQAIKAGATEVTEVADKPIYLPKNLQGAKPRYGMGNKLFEPKFDSDLDKALFIVGQKTPSKRNQDYINFIKKYTGLDDNQISVAAKELKDKLKIYLKDQPEAGAVKVPKLNTLKTQHPDRPVRTLSMSGAGNVEVVPGKNIITGKPTTPTSPPPPNVPPPPNIPPSGPPQVALPDPQIPRVEITDLTNAAAQEAKVGPIRRVLAEGRQLQTAFDLSFPFRQGISNVTRKEFWNSFGPMLKSAASEEGYKALQASITRNPYFDLMQKSGLEITELGKNVGRREEQLRGTFLEKLGGKYSPIRASNRAYTAFANKLRADTFARMAKDAEKAGALDDISAKAIAKFVNDATGRGHLGQLEKNAVLLNDFVFSPKLIGSRINMFRRAFQDPRMIAKGVDPAVAKELRKEALRSMMGVGGLALTSIGVSKLAGAEGTEDPRSTDFGKIKIGKTRLDLTGGFQQYIRVAAQIASGQQNIDGNVQDRNRASVAGRFAWNKLSPAAGAVVDWMVGENVIGEEFTLSNEAKNKLIPLIAQDIYEIYQEDPDMLPLTTPASMFGVGVQSYGPNVEQKLPTLKRIPRLPR